MYLSIIPVPEHFLTSWRSWAILEKMQLCRHSRTSKCFMAPEVSLPYSQEPSSSPYPEPERSSPYHPIPSRPISLRSILIFSTHLRLGLPSGLFPSGFPINILYRLSRLSKESVQVRCFLWIFRNKPIFYGEELLAPRLTPKPEDYPLSAVRDCLFNIFAVTLHIWRPSPSSATWGRAMPWWQGTHLTWLPKHLQIPVHKFCSPRNC
jgi:hypothetical protein